MASEHTGGWRDIETDPPPKDGTWFLVCRASGGIVIAGYDDQGRKWRGRRLYAQGSGAEVRNATHWMPLPDPPAALALTAGET